MVFDVLTTNRHLSQQACDKYRALSNPDCALERIGMSSAYIRIFSFLLCKETGSRFLFGSSPERTFT